MKLKHSKLPLATLSALALFTACRRDIVPPSESSLTDARAVTSSITDPGFLPGSVVHVPVSIALTTTCFGGQGTTLLNRPAGVASDGSGPVWISDFDNNQIKIVAPGSNVVFVTVGSGASGSQDGSFSTASFNHPSGIALGPDGILYVADMGNNRIRAVDLAGGTVTTFAGAGVAGFNDGTPAVAKFNQPSGVAVDRNGVVYVADQGNNMIRRIINKSSVTRWAGQLTPGSQDGSGSLASFNAPRGIAVAPGGAVYVADILNNKIRKIVSGVVTTFAGSGQGLLRDGVGSAAAFDFPSAVAVDSSGYVYVTDQANFAIRMITPAGTVSTLAGGQTRGFNDGPDLTAQFQAPNGITVDHKGNILVTDGLGPSLRKITVSPAVKSFVGNGQHGYQEGTGTGAIFYAAISAATAPDGTVYVFDVQQAGSRIRKITPGGTTSLYAGGAVNGFKDGPAAQAEFGANGAVAVAPDGTVYVADADNNRIRKIAGGIVTTLAGTGLPADIDDTGARASIFAPDMIATDRSGNVYVCSSHTGKLRRVTPGGVVKTVNQADISTFAISGLAIDAQGHRFMCMNNSVIEFTADFQPATAYFTGPDVSGSPVIQNWFAPLDLAVDAKGVLYVTDFRYIAAIGPDRTMRLLAGTGENVDAVTDGPVTQASFVAATRIAYSSAGILYVLDYASGRIRMLSAL